MEKYELSDYQWEQIKDFIPPKTSKCGRPRRDPRELINAVVWVLRTGAPWRALPKEYGNHHTAYNNFVKWTKEGVMAKIFEEVAPEPDETDELQMDSTYVKAHQHSTGAKKGGLKQKQ